MSFMYPSLPWTHESFNDWLQTQLSAENITQFNDFERNCLQTYLSLPLSVQWSFLAARASQDVFALPHAARLIYGAELLGYVWHVADVVAGTPALHAKRLLRQAAGQKRKRKPGLCGKGRPAIEAGHLTKLTSLTSTPSILSSMYSS